VLGPLTTADSWEIAGEPFMPRAAPPRIKMPCGATFEDSSPLDEGGLQGGWGAPRPLTLLPYTRTDSGVGCWMLGTNPPRRSAPPLQGRGFSEVLVYPRSTREMDVRRYYWNRQPITQSLGLGVA